MNQRRKNYFIFSGILLGFLYLFLSPRQASAAITDALRLCFQTIIPSMFPYFVLSELFVSLGCAELLGRKLSKIMEKIFHISGTGASPLLLGLVGGYPLGAKTVADLYCSSQLTKADAERLLFFCCNAGPAFIIGVVGGALYRSAMVGISLYLIHVFSALLCGLFISAGKRETHVRQNISKKALPFSGALVHAVDGALHTTGKVCAFILLFSIFIGIEKQVIQNSLFLGILSGLTELSTGCAALAAAELSWPLKFTLTSVFLAFGGICVLCQTLAVTVKSQLPMRRYFSGKLLQSIISAAIAFPVSYFLKPVTETANLTIMMTPASPFPWNFLPILLFALIFLQLPPRNSPLGEL